MTRIRDLTRRVNSLTAASPDADLLTPEHASELRQVLTLARSYTTNPTEVQELQAIEQEVHPDVSESQILIRCRYLPVEIQRYVFQALEALVATQRQRY